MVSGYIGFFMQKGEFMTASARKTEISKMIGKLLRSSFGKGPETLIVSTGDRYIVMYLKNFLSPMEQVLLEKGKENNVLRIRDAMMKKLSPEIKTSLQQVFMLDVTEFYYDWNLAKRSGILVGQFSDPIEENEIYSIYPEKEQIHCEIMMIEQELDTLSEEMKSYRLNDRTLVAVRNGAFSNIEKALSRFGHSEVVKQVKSSMEKKMFMENKKLPKIFNARIDDLFIDWNDEKNKGILVFIFGPALS